MGSWSESNVCINVSADKLDLVRKICDCLDINESTYFDVYHSSSFDYGHDYNYFGLDWQFRGTDSGGNGCELFSVLEKLFGNIQFCFIDDTGSDVDDHVYIDGTMYDSNIGKKYYETIAFCEGEQTVGEDDTNIHECLPWELIKEKIDARAVEQGIEISWRHNGEYIEPDYDYDDFCSLCDDIFWEEFSYWDSGRTIQELPIEPVDYEINGDIVDLIKTEAIKRGYTDVLEFLGKYL